MELIIIIHRAVVRVKLNHKMEEPGKEADTWKSLDNVIGNIHRTHIK